jgi:hypothetical protein
MWLFYFPPGESASGLADYSSTPAFVNLVRIFAITIARARIGL